MSFRQVNVRISYGLVTQRWVVFSLTLSKTSIDF